MSGIQPLKIDYAVRGFDCGYGGPFRVLSLVNFFQEAAGMHASALDLGVEKLRQQGRTWMLSRMDLRIDAMPQEGEGVSVETWPSGMDRLFALRDLVMRGKDGNVLARAAYAYLIVDIEARRPVRPERMLSADLVSDAGRAIPDYRFDIPAAECPDMAFIQRACPRHVDRNEHVNNAHLVDWLVDAVRAGGKPEGRDLRGIRVEFRAEVLPRDELQARSGAAFDCDESGQSRPDGAFRAVPSELRRGAEVAARALTVWSAV